MRSSILTLLACASLAWLHLSAAAATEIPITGEPVPELAAFDAAMTNFMRANSIKGGALAVMKDGRLVLKHGYGWSDKAQTVPFHPDARARIASNSKTFTAAAIQHLIERGVIATNTPAIPFAGLEPYNGQWGDPRWRETHVLQFLEHSSGWDNDIPDYFEFSSTIGLDHAGTMREMISYILTRRLKFQPGTRIAYSSPSYGVLAQVIESASSVDYFTYVSRHVGRTWGIRGIGLQRTEPKLRPADEPYYDDGGAPPLRNNADFPTEELLPVPDGGGYYLHESSIGPGGLIANVESLVTLAQVCLISHGKAFLPVAEIPTSRNGDRRRWRHLRQTGSQLGEEPGANSFNFQNTNGVDFAFFLNRSVNHGNLAITLKRLTETLTSWPGDNAARITLAAESFIVGEEEGELVVGVRRTGDSQGEIAVGYATLDGTGRAATDFTATSGTLTFAEDEITRTLTIPIIDNAHIDGNRRFALVLNHPSSGLLGIASATIVIEDGEAPEVPPAVAIVSPGSREVLPPNTNLTIAVSVSPGSRPLSKIDFFAGPTWLGEENKPDYTFTWKKPPVGSYQLTAVATDDRGVRSTSARVLITVGTAELADRSGPLLREFWMRRPGSTLTNLTTYTHFPAKPTGWEYLSTFEKSGAWGDYYGSRLTGWLVPPASGAYAFWIAADDQAQLWLADSEVPASKQLIASVSSATAPRQWDRSASQKSAPVTLLAGRRYYLEALHKERIGNDHLAVAWQLPDGTLEQPIPGSRFVGVNGVSELDLSFKPLSPAEPNQAVPPEVFEILAQPDGKIIAFGPLFPGWWPHRGLARFNYDGTFDTTFSPATHGFPLGLQPDGKILIRRNDGASSSRLIRLQSDGSLDPTFKFELPFGGGGNLALEPDGSILIAMMMRGGGLNDSEFQILRLNSDGSQDRTFQPFHFSVDYATAIVQIASHTSGRLLVSGSFRGAGALDRLPRVIRLNPDGSLDPSFGPGGPARVVPGSLGSAWIDTMTMQPDGKALVVGNFNQFAGVRCGSIVRLNVDGTIDSSFEPGLGARTPPCRFIPGLTSPAAPCLAGGLPARIWRIALQPGRKIVIAGMFDRFDGVPRLGLARLHSNGSVDMSYALSGGLLDENSEPALIEALAVAPNGDILVGGTFAQVEGVAVSGLARLNGELPGGVITGWSANTHALTLATHPGRTHVLDVSDDLAQWLPLRTNTASGPFLEMPDPGAAKLPHRFYRVKVAEP